MQVVKILSWNTQRNKQALEVMLEDAARKYDLLAIQEPWINPHTHSTYCPRSSHWHLVHAPGGRSAIYINKRIPTALFGYEMEDLWCRVWIGDALGLWCVYNPPDTKEVPERLLQLPRPTRPTVVAGDFNIHHPLWDQHHRYDRKADHLLQLALQWDLILCTPYGTITRAPQGTQQGRTSTIDHLWASPALQTTYYGLHFRGRSDHYPQVLEVFLGQQQQQPTKPPPGWSWKLFNRYRAEAEAKSLPVTMGLDTGELEREVLTVEGLRSAFDRLVAELTRIADSCAPRRKACNGYQAHWWNAEVKELARDARKAERRFKEVPCLETRQLANKANKALAKAVKLHKTAAWRNTLKQADRDRALLWKLERWARTKSHLPAELPKLPSLEGPDGLTLSTHEDKANALAQRFFPNPPADLSDILDPGLTQQWEPKFQVPQGVSVQEIEEVLRTTAPWKAPGLDYLPTGLLKACGRPLARILAVLTTACFRLGWFPERFKMANTVVLQKPGKAPAVYRTPSGYRPIALLPTIGKVIESVIARRIAAAAEANGLLPDEQMGNRAHRSTELAIRLLVAQIQEAWRQGVNASLLQLDISGAFDTVNHVRLLDTLRQQGFPRWLVVWVKDWLSDRKAILQFDGQSTQPFAIRAGVPQGSPLSPILFILYIASLYTSIKERHPGISIVGFADDTNLVAYGRSGEGNAVQLAEAFETCLQWARTRGMAFAPEKSELLHFNKGRRQWADPVILGQTTIKPTTSARFLGVWLDRRLTWKAHKDAVVRKLKTQELALSRIAAKTWGPGMARAREVYIKCIRSAIAYGASNYHTPTVEGRPLGIARDLSKAQSRSLRVVTGAYRATPVRTLETEAMVPPLDLYLNKRRADFEARLQQPSLPGGRRPLDVIQQACNKPYYRFSQRRRKARPQGPTWVERTALQAQQWAQGRPTDDRVFEDWKARWQADVRLNGRKAYRPADWDPLFSIYFSARFSSLSFKQAVRKAMARHANLSKAHSSLLTQARSGVIGLRSYLFKAQVPDIYTPYCPCGLEEETVEHLVVRCPRPPAPRTFGNLTKRDLFDAFHGITGRARKTARRVLDWLMQSGRLTEYRLAARLNLDSED